MCGQIGQTVATWVSILEGGQIFCAYTLLNILYMQYDYTLEVVEHSRGQRNTQLHLVFILNFSHALKLLSSLYHSIHLIVKSSLGLKW
jgi:hypothetical protein